MIKVSFDFWQRRTARKVLGVERDTGVQQCSRIIWLFWNDYFNSAKALDIPFDIESFQPLTVGIADQNLEQNWVDSVSAHVTAKAADAVES